MIILQIASIDNNPYNGVPRAVPGMVNALRDAQVGFLNVRDIRINGIDCQLMPKEYSLDALPYPFNRPDIVVFHEVYYPAFIRLGKECRKYNIPYLIIPHGCLTKEALNIKKWKKRIGNQLMFSDFVMGAEALQFLSPNEKRRTIFKKDGFIGMNGVDPDRCQKENFNADTEPAEKPYTVFTYIGRIDMHIKGLDLLVRAVGRIQETLRENLCCIRLYGPDCNDSKAALTGLIGQQGVSDLIELNGPVEDSEKESILLNSDMFIQTSRSEALPMGLLEALSYGIPCIVSRGTGFADLINRYNAGWGEPRGQTTGDDGVSRIAGMMLSAVLSKDEYREKSENAGLLIEEHFDKRKLTAKLIQKYKSFCRQSVKYRDIKLTQG